MTNYHYHAPHIMPPPSPSPASGEGKGWGVLYGVGVGPGGPELLTFQAVRVLKEVDVIAVPKSKEEGRSSALSIVEEVVDLRGKVILEIVLPMTKDKDILLKARRDAILFLSERLKTGKNVAYITLGDPMFYSTFSYLIPLIMDTLPGVKVKVIPGVSSINAASGSTLLPLAEADERVALIPATYDKEGLKGIIRDFDTVVLMKVNKVMDKVVAILDELGLKDRAVFVSRAGWPEEVIIWDLDNLRGKRLDYFSMVIVKKGL